jgi:acyl phosphate:glycerol-3-phosphate acyltransferase
VELFLWLMAGYIFGSIPFGLLFTHMAGLGDIRTVGSGNIGATNVLRTGNKTLAALTLLFDAFKGFAPVALAAYYAPNPAFLAAAAGAIAGHLYPVWLGFKGGKGVATLIGVIFAFDWLLGLAFLCSWLVIAFLTRISSVSALAAALLSPAFAWILGHELIWPLLLFAAVIWYRHAANIQRLIAGEEPKISFASKQ